MAGVFDEWETTNVTVDTPGAVTYDGASTIASHAVLCGLEYGEQVVTATDGTQTVSTTRLFAGIDQAAVVVPGAVVHLPASHYPPNGRTARVIAVTSVAIGDPDLDGLTASLT